MGRERVILHCDLNNFYASVECRYDPRLRTVPMAVGGSEQDRHGIVLAKNELAKQFGIKTAETLWQARQKCPNLVVVPPHFDRYYEISRAVRAIYARYTDRIEPFGIDECWLDVTGSTLLFDSGVEIAERLRREVREELGVTISVGVSFNKVFAKLGSDLKKPDAVSVIPSDRFREIVWGLSAREMIGVGESTARQLEAWGCTPSASWLSSTAGCWGKSWGSTAMPCGSAPMERTAHRWRWKPSRRRSRAWGTR